MALGNLAKLVFWSILSSKRGSFAKLLIFFVCQFLRSALNLGGLRGNLEQKNPAKVFSHFASFNPKKNDDVAYAGLRRDAYTKGQ